MRFAQACIGHQMRNRERPQRWSGQAKMSVHWKGLNLSLAIVLDVGFYISTTFCRSHDRIDGRRQPTRHQAVLNWDRCDLGVRQALWDQHQTRYIISNCCNQRNDAEASPNRQTSNNIVDDPSRIVSRQPSDYWSFVDNIMCCCRRRCLQASFRETTNSVPRVVRADVVDRSVDYLHDDQRKYVSLCRS